MNTSDKTFSTFDKFGLEPFADQLTKYLLVESQFVEGSFVLSLNSEFGSGKTTFFEMWREKLKSGEYPHHVVYLNAWKTDFQGDALLAVVSGLLESFKSQGNEKDKESIKETAGKLCKFALSIGNDVVKKFTGIDPIGAGKYTEQGESKSEATLGHTCFQIYKERQKIFSELESQLKRLTKESENPIIIIIDELDRCRPTYAIEFLETIKHFFDIDGLIFVLGVDKGQLTSSAKSLFGQDIDFDEYYRKFAHRNVTLPVKSKEMTERFCRKLVNEYFSIEAFERRKRFPYLKIDSYRIDEIVTLTKQFSFNARQIHELFRIASHVLSSINEVKSNRTWGWIVGTFFMITLYLKDEILYHRIGRKEISLKEFTSNIKKYNFIQSNPKHNYFWARLLYTGSFDKDSYINIKQEFIELGVNIPSEYSNVSFNDQLVTSSCDFYGTVFVRSDSAFSEIYKILEGLKTFEEQ